MSNLSKNAASKLAYTKPTLTEYGSLAERTKIFGLNPDLDPSSDDLLTLTPSITVTL